MSVINGDIDIEKFMLGDVEVDSMMFGDIEVLSGMPTEVEFDFAYLGKTEQFIVPYTGLWKVECWGAGASWGGTGQSDSRASNGGAGGYECGYKKLNKDDVLYICCGQAGMHSMSNTFYQSAYNGGSTVNGYPWWPSYQSGSTGGGGTHIATVDGTTAAIGQANLDKFLLIAGGGGGAYGGSGGGAGGGTSGGGASFGQGSTQGYNGGGGGGYIGGTSRVGGTGYRDGCPEIVYKGVTYSPTYTNGVNTGAGKAKLTFIKK